MNKPRILFWHRKDLRIFDNQALIKAFSLSNAITSTYIFDKNYSHDFNASSRAWFLGNSLQELGNNWKKMGSRLVMEEGDPVLIIPQLAKKIDAKFVFWNRSIEPYEINRDLKIKKNLGGWVAGCDICQEVCPWNKSVPYNNNSETTPKEWIKNLNIESLDWDDKTWQENLKGTTLKRIKPWMWKRNIQANINNKKIKI